MIARTTTTSLTLTAAGLFAVCLALPALAQSEADQEACTPDVFRLCQAYIPNEAPIVACLQAKRAQLSPACHKVFSPPAEAAATAPASPPHRRHARHHHRRSSETNGL